MIISRGQPCKGFRKRNLSNQNPLVDLSNLYVLRLFRTFHVGEGVRYKKAKNSEKEVAFIRRSQPLYEERIGLRVLDVNEEKTRGNGVTLTSLNVSKM